MKNGYSNGHGRLRFPLVAFADIVLDTKRRYLIKNLIPRDGLIVFWGPPKCGKSFLVSDLAFHIALGWDYRGRRVEQGTVVYVACEGQTGFKARVEAFKQHHLAEDPECAPPFHLLATRLDLAVDADELIHDIAAQLGAAECSCIVLDTLNRSLGGSESKDEDMSAYIQACDKVREAFHCSVVIIHHCGIEGTRPRGHTSLSGAADAQIAVKRDNSKNIVATIEYMKDGPDDGEFVSRLVPVVVGFDEDEEEITSCIIESTDEAPNRPEKRTSKLTLSAAAKVALKTLSKAIGEAGTDPPGSNHIPIGVRVVSVEMWRRFHYVGTGDAELSPDARKKDFQRARTSLLAVSAIGIHDNLCWIVSDAY